VVNQDHQLPALVPLRFVASAGEELVTHLAAGADPVRPGEAGGAHHELSRVLHQLNPVCVAVLVVFEAAALEDLGGRANCGGSMLAKNLSLNPDEFVMPRDWGEGVGAIGGPLRMKVAVRDAGTASVAGFHRFAGGCSGGGRSAAGVLKYLSYHSAGFLAGSFDRGGGGCWQGGAAPPLLLTRLHRGPLGGRQVGSCTDYN
jgi:hypothetical protein